MSYTGQLVIDAVIVRLDAAGLVVGDGDKPAAGAGWSGDAGQSSFVGYVVVHAISGGNVDGPIGATSDDVTPLVQLSSYGATRSQCELVGDRARVAMFAAPIVVTGRVVASVVIGMLGGSIRFDDVQPPVWQFAERFSLITTPS